MSTEWHRFSEVKDYVLTGRRLFRSSAPNYIDKDNNDSTQRLTQSAVDFLVGKGINSIISFNEYSYTDAEKKLLEPAGITYHHLSVKDGHAPTIDQLKNAIAFFRGKSNAKTLVHCGYGHGRTGTGITALQLDATSGQQPKEEEWASVNKVEEKEQLAVLRQLRDSYKQEL